MSPVPPAPTAMLGKFCNIIERKIFCPEIAIIEREKRQGSREGYVEKDAAFV